MNSFPEPNMPEYTFWAKAMITWPRLDKLLLIAYIENVQEEENQIRGCSHITSAKIRGSWTPLVSNGQHLA